MSALPFELDPADVLDPVPRAVLDDGAVYAAAQRPGTSPPRLPPLLIVAWLEEPAGATLDDVVAEELQRLPVGSLLLDYQPATVASGPAVRTLTLHPQDAGPPTASEQWRLLAGGRRWTVSALTALADQPLYGPLLAAPATSLRPRPA